MKGRIFRGLLLCMMVLIVSGFGGVVYGQTNSWLDGTGTNDIHYSLGNVGIGTDSPEKKLDVNGSVRAVYEMDLVGVTIQGGANNDTEDTRTSYDDDPSNPKNKQFNILAATFNYKLGSPDKFFSLIRATALSGINSVAFGGGNSTYGTATEVLFYTAPTVGITGHPDEDSTVMLSLKGGSDVIFNENGDNVDLTVNDDAGNALLYTDASAKRVGIGTTTPSEKLDVVGNIKLSGNIYNSDGNGLSLQASSTITNGGAIRLADITNPTPDDFAIRFDNANGEVMRIDDYTKYVGIGTTDPKATLHANGTVRANYFESNLYGIGDWRVGAGVESDNTGDFIFYENQGYGLERLRITKSGNVGIGTTIPSERLEVIGKIKGTHLCIGSECRDSWPDAGDYNFTGNVGIGITTAAKDLHISRAGFDPTIRLERTDAAARTIWDIMATGDNLNFYDQENNPGGSPRVTFDGQGEVGIGTVNPDSALTINGTTEPSSRLSVMNTNPATSGTTKGAIIEVGSNGHAGISTGHRLGALVFQGRGNDSEYPGAAIVSNVTNGGDISRSLHETDLRFYTKRSGQNGYNEHESTPDIIIKSNGDVGMGKEDPAWPLDVAGVIGGHQFRSASTNGNWWLGETHLLNDNTGDFIIFEAQNFGLERLRITKSGKVGIGATPSGSYQLNLGGDINATGVCIAGDCRDSWPGTSGNYNFTGNVGVGTDNPTGRLNVQQSGGVGGGFSAPIVRLEDNTVEDRAWDIYGSDGAGAPKHRFGISDTTISTSVEQWRFIIDADGKTGIGIHDPASKLHVHSDNTIPAAIQLTNTSTGRTSADGARIILDGSNNLNIIQKEDGDINFHTNNIPRMIIDNAGNVGIGNNNPDATLTVENTHTNTDVAMLSDSTSAINIRNAGSDPGVFNAISFQGHGNDSYIAHFNNATTANSRFGFFIGGYTSYTAADERFTIMGNGNVGIGNNSPSEMLDVAGRIKGTELCIGDECRDSWPGTSGNYNFTGNVGIGGAIGLDAQLTVHGPTGNSVVEIVAADNISGSLIDFNGATSGRRGRIHYAHIDDSLRFYTNGDSVGPRMVIGSDGKVGIGTLTPEATLHVSGEAFGWGVLAKFERTAGDSADMTVQSIGDGVNGFIGFATEGNIGFSAGVTTGIDTHDARSGSDLVIDTNGKVGIGIQDPSEALDVVGNVHVTGNITVDGNINAKYQDLAEWVEVNEYLDAGTVVMIDPVNENRVLASEAAYNTLVAGVVSPMPGILLGEAGDDKAVIAHTGRVKVKVDTSNGAINIGDLLVTSPLKGYAMKADYAKLKPGMMLGKALQALEVGQKGEVLTLITLQ